MSSGHLILSRWLYAGLFVPYTAVLIVLLLTTFPSAPVATTVGVSLLAGAFFTASTAWTFELARRR